MLDPANASADPASAQDTTVRRYQAVVCTACGCSCDDIELILDGRRLIEAAQACSIGQSWFATEAKTIEVGSFAATIDGRPSAFNDAIGRSVELLREARSPVILGLTRTAMETVQVAVTIADKVGGAIDAGFTSNRHASTHSFQRQGKVTSTLGEVKNRADVVVFWGADPVSTHPRHFERYSAASNGRFRPRGRSDRTVFAVDQEETATARSADAFLGIAADRQLEAIWMMRAILQGRPAIEADGREGLCRIVTRLKEAEFSAVFFDTHYGGRPQSLATIEALSRFIRELNEFTRCVLLPLGGPGNRAGAEAVLSWQTGFPNGVDLGSGHPESIPGVTSSTDRLERGEADLALIVADPISESLSDAAIQTLRGIPQIVVSPATVGYDFEPSVRFFPPNPFLATKGTLIRCDGVALPLRAPLGTGSPSDRECLLRMEAMLSTKDRV